MVLDPGHGGIDGGAYGVGGAVEKTLVYEYALELQRRLEAKGRYKVVLTRHGDEFVSLDDRVRRARDAGASLLISIHADRLSAAADVAGATVYTCSERASDAEAARVAEHENAADKAAGVEPKAQAPEWPTSCSISSGARRAPTPISSRAAWWESCRGDSTQSQSRALGRLRRPQGARLSLGAD